MNHETDFPTYFMYVGFGITTLLMPALAIGIIMLLL